ncbi:hypothetical protein EDB84DRAFT_1437356 [Lactarius hengduanensis]|nr:hypothetical protein EDB84DRAFT_1437356 [Lactarius hengduanensis]
MAASSFRLQALATFGLKPEDVVFSDQGRQDSLGHQLSLSLRAYCVDNCLSCVADLVFVDYGICPTASPRCSAKSGVVKYGDLCRVLAMRPPAAPANIPHPPYLPIPRSATTLPPSLPLVRMQAIPTRDSPTASARGIPPHRSHSYATTHRSCITTFPTAAPSHHGNCPSHRHPNAVMPTATATAVTTTRNDDRDDDDLATTLP